MEQKSQIPFDKRIHACAVNFLINDKETEVALFLSACSVNLQVETRYWNGVNYALALSAPRHIFETIREQQKTLGDKIRGAFNAVLPVDNYVTSLYFLPV